MNPDRIRIIRTGLGLTQAMLAKLLRVDTHTVGSWEAGRRRPWPRHLAALARLERRYVRKFTGPAAARLAGFLRRPLFAVSQPEVAAHVPDATVLPAQEPTASADRTPEPAVAGRSA